MKTHGEKRVRAILEIFHAVHTLVAGMGTQEHLVVRIVPRADRSGGALDGPGLAAAGRPRPSRKSSPISSSPLLEQVRIDATQQIAALAENRLGVGGPITSVRQAARRWA